MRGRTRESNGDYRLDAPLVEDAALTLYQHQHTLPRLPVPSLQETTDKYLASVHALLTQHDRDEGGSSTTEQYRRTEAAVRDFLQPGGMGPVLQRRLLQRAKEHGRDSSYLALWWNQLGYLQVRDPVPINISYFYHFKDSPVPAQRSQCGRAASLVHAALLFRQQVVSGRLPPDGVGRGKQRKPLCTTPYKYMFNTCRIPRREQDTYALHDPSLHQHIVVTVANRLFELTVTDADGSPASVHTLEAQLQAVLAGSGPVRDGTPPVGVLTAWDRDSWADARARLLGVSDDGGEGRGEGVGRGSNRERLERIESAALVLCLDEARPVTKKEVGRQLLHGDGNNRWWDKPIQLVVFANAKAGLIGEHAMMDGTPSLRLASFMLRHSMTARRPPTSSSYTFTPGVGELAAGHPGGQAASHPPVRVAAAPARCLDLVLPATSMRDVSLAWAAHQSEVAAHGFEALEFVAYGAAEVKKWGMSPDAFAQQALQLAYYSMCGCVRPTYEPAQVSIYLHGRTACIRAVTDSSVAWVKRMRDNSEPQEEEEHEEQQHRLRLLRDATKRHSTLAREAAQGKDCDRHLFGLKLMLKDGEASPDKLPALFADPAFSESKTWAVSTSNISHELFDGWGFGEVVRHGVGLAYMVKQRSFHFQVAARTGLAGQERWPERLCHHLQEALLDMRRVCEEGGANMTQPRL